MTSIHLLIGPNAYSLLQERLRWMRGFRQKHGDENLAILQGKDLTIKEIIQEISISPFLAEKRLVIVEGMPKAKKGDAEQFAQHIHPSVILLFVVEIEKGSKLKQTVFEKELRTVGQTTECPLLDAAQLHQWMDALAKEFGAALSPEARKALIEQGGEDQQVLRQEIEKLALYAVGRVIERTDVELLLACHAEKEAWELMDVLGAQRPEAALAFAHRLLDRGLSPSALWNSLLWMIVQMVNVRSCIEAGERNSWTIAKTLHAHGGSVKAILPWVQRIDAQRLEMIVASALAADRGLKTGEYKATAEAPEEHLALIDQTLCAFARIS